MIYSQGTRVNSRKEAFNFKPKVLKSINTVMQSCADHVNHVLVGIDYEHNHNVHINAVSLSDDLDINSELENFQVKKY